MIKEISPSPALAVSLAELKTLLRIDHDLEDALLMGLLRTATDMAETHLGFVLLQREFEQRWTHEFDDPVRLQRSPFISVTGASLAGQALIPIDYAVAMRAYDEAEISVLAPGIGELRVTFFAGMSDSWNGISDSLRFGIMRQAAHLYAHRDAATAVAIPSAVLALWQPYRKVRLT